MDAPEFSAAQVVKYDLQIAIDSACDRVWTALVEQTNDWWPADSRVLGESSVVTLTAQAGGGLIEQVDGADSLLWGTVQMCQPKQHTLYLILHTAHDWGGPMVSTMKIAVEASGDDRCLLKVTDAIVGRVSEIGVQQLQQGWTDIFAGGLKKFVETNAS
ncbi:hypothetical protein [Aeoliella sp.]|uniref:hypothetical protein n=1 Tax=Aeoliella sp. TaxID=2795800 RepID=UPI003CCC1E1E